MILFIFPSTPFFYYYFTILEICYFCYYCFATFPTTIGRLRNRNGKAFMLFFRHLSFYFNFFVDVLLLLFNNLRDLFTFNKLKINSSNWLKFVIILGLLGVYLI